MTPAPSQSPKSKLLAIVAVAVLALLVAALAWYRPLAGSKPGNQRITLAVNVSPLSTLAIIAEKKQFFSEEGLTIAESKFTSGKLALDAVLGGGADIAMVAETPLVFAGMGGQDFRIVATMFLSGNACKVVARADRNIRTPDDLRGRRLATFVGTNAEWFMHKFLSKHAIQDDQVTVLNLSPTDMVIALGKGDIDGYFVWEPHVFNGRDLVGSNGVVFEEPGLYTTTFNVVVRPTFAAENQKAIEAFIRGLRRAAKYTRDNAPDSVKIVSDYTGIPEQTLSAIWKDYQFPVSLDNTLVTYMTEQADWAVSTKRAKGPIPDYQQFIDRRALDAASR